MRKKSVTKELTSCFYKGNVPIFILAVFAAFVGGFLNLIVSWIMQKLIDAASGIEGAISLGRLAEISCAFVALCIALFLLKYFSQPRYILRAISQYKDFAFKKLIEKNISSFRDERTAIYLSALTNDASSIEENYILNNLQLITKAVTFFGALAMMIWYSPLLTAISIAVTVLPFVASILTGNKLQSAEKAVSDKNADFAAMISDCLCGFSVIKTFKAEKEIFELFSKSNKTLEKGKFDRNSLKILVGMIGSVTGIIAQLGVFIAGAWLAINGELTAGTVILFVNLMNFIIQPVAELPSIIAGRKAALALIEKLALSLEKNTDCGGDVKLDGVKSGICLNNVSFGYEVNKPVLKSVSVDFRAGKAYAMVGGSGSGKSTLLNLLTGGSSDYDGKILFDGKELRDISSESLYENVSVIQQNVFVFNASIEDNVTMFRAFDKEEVCSAIAHAHLDELIKAKGSDYLCGENGCNLSGGEKQRISIARSLLKKSSVLIADEATSALDAQTARNVSDDILDLKGITRIVVTHALDEALLRRYDEILVMKNGEIVEKGSFDELMNKKEYFNALYTVSKN